MVMSYVCKFKPKLGVLNLEKCLDRGVPPGPLLGQLKNGNDIVLPNGTTVLSSDVRDPDDPGPIFLIIDVPSHDYLDSLLKTKAFHEFQNENSDNQLKLILHFTPDSIVDTTEYTEFINKFSLNVKHWFINGRNK